MPLYWIAYGTPRGRQIHIIEASYLLGARLKAQMAGQDGDFVEGHELPKAMARKVPKSALGRPLNSKEAEALVVKMGRP